MKPELEAQLYNLSPELYRDRTKPMNETCMCWGFECGDGWFKLLARLGEQLNFFRSEYGVNIKAVQVKEKYGTLRYYYVIPEPERLWHRLMAWLRPQRYKQACKLAEALITHAEVSSGHICEACGEWGTLNTAGWMQVLCEDCEAKQKTERVK